MSERREESGGSLSPAVDRALQTIGTQIERVAQLTAAPQEIGHVLAVCGPPEPRRDPAAFQTGSRVRLLTGSHRGQYGRTLVPPDEGGKAYVQLDHGARIEISVGNGSHEEAEAEVVGARGTVIVTLPGGATIAVDLPPDLTVQVGDTVSLSVPGRQIVGSAEHLPIGTVVVVERVAATGSAEVSYRDGTKTILTGTLGDVRRGDRLILDPTDSVATANLGQTLGRFQFAESPNVSWDSIVGQDEAKRVLRKLARQLLQPNRRRRPAKGVLLLGPPGCGKTLSVKAFATELLALAGGRGADSCFLVIRGPELLGHLLGQNEQTVRQVFAEAREHRRRHGYPAVIYITECESILKKRGTGIGTDFMDTLVPAFLIEMDGLSASDAVVVCDTNRADVLDPAVVRPGRLDRKVYVGRPNQAQAMQLFELYLKQVALTAGADAVEWATRASAELFSDRYPLYEIVHRVRESEGDPRDVTYPFGLRDVASGALIESVVTQGATEAAEARLGDSGDADVPVTWDDLLAAIASAHQQQRPLNMDEDLKDFSSRQIGDLVGVRRVRQTVS